jgi:hypothetical protein
MPAESRRQRRLGNTERHRLALRWPSACIPHALVLLPEVPEVEAVHHFVRQELRVADVVHFTLRIICLEMTCRCLPLILTPCNRYTSWIPFTRYFCSFFSPSTDKIPCGLRGPSIKGSPAFTRSPSRTLMCTSRQQVFAHRVPASLNAHLRQARCCRDSLVIAVRRRASRSNTDSGPFGIQGDHNRHTSVIESN